MLLGEEVTGRADAIRLEFWEHPEREVADAHNNLRSDGTPQIPPEKPLTSPIFSGRHWSCVSKKQLKSPRHETQAPNHQQPKARFVPLNLMQTL